MKITFYYDYICPFCYIASERILKLSKTLDFSIEWKGIETVAEYSNRDKRKKSVYLKQRTQNLLDIAKEDNIKIKLPGFVTNTGLCLEAGEYAKTENKFLEFHKECYKAYFIRGINIGLIENIINISKRVGLNSDRTAESIQKREFKEKIESNKKDADKNIVLGVPTLFFNELKIHGAQSIESYKNIILKVSNKTGSID